jgi:Pretoxin HINT domain
MIAAALVSSAVLFAALPDSLSPTSAADQVAYETARNSAGRDADAHTRLALWCEARGMDAERIKHLTIAVLVEPSHAVARGLLGRVADGKDWRKPEQISKRIGDDPNLSATLAKYRLKRARTLLTVDAQWELAAWCEQHGLKPESKAHYSAVTRFDPARADAWRKLGYQLYRGVWLDAAQIDAEKAEAKRQATADRYWAPIFEKVRLQLLRSETRAEAERTIAGVDDPRSVPTAWRTFAIGGPTLQAIAVQLLGQSSGTASSRALATLAADGRSAGVRHAAFEILARRDPREFADLLVGLLRDPVEYEVKPVGGPGSPGALFVEGERFNLQRIYQAPPVVTLANSTGAPYAGFSPGGRPVIIRAGEGGASFMQSAFFNNPAMDYAVERFEHRTTAMIAEATKVAASSEARLEEDVRALEAINGEIYRINAPLVGYLETISGRSLGSRPEAWRAWWIDSLGYDYHRVGDVNKPTLMQTVCPTYQPEVPQGFSYSSSSGYMPMSCFAGGTPIQTITGTRAIETIQVGDRVLSQDVTTGALTYQPVLATFHNPPAETLRINIGGETIVSTRFHRFWRAGLGWATARELAGDDAIRTLKGRRTISTIEAGAVQPVFNLEVGGGKTFLVGAIGALVHDNTLPGPKSEPFDAVPTDLVANLAR